MITEVDTTLTVWHNPTDLANSISPENFELFLRAYMAKHFARFTKNPNIVMLVVSTGYGATAETAKVNWNIGTSNEQTVGEILASCIDEYNRRQEFTKTNTLWLIEG